MESSGLVAQGQEFSTVPSESATVDKEVAAVLLAQYERLLAEVEPANPDASDGKLDADEEEGDDDDVQDPTIHDDEESPPPARKRKSRTADTQESSKKERATGSQAETETPRPTKQQKTPQNVDPNFNGNDWVEVYGNDKCDRCAKADVCFKPKDRGRKTCWRCSHYKKQCADGRDKQPVTPKPVARASGEKVDTRLGNNIGDRLLQAFETHVAAIDSAMHKTEINIAIVRERLAEIRDDNGQLMGRMATIEDRLNTIKEKCGSDDVGSP